MTGIKRNPLSFATVSEIGALFAAGKLSPVEYCRVLFSEIESSNSDLNAFVQLDRDASIKAAELSEKRWAENDSLGPFDGIPVSIKSTLSTDDWAPESGSKLLQDLRLAHADCPVAAQLRRRGAVLFGSTTTPEFAVGATTASTLYGVTRNPWDRSKTPGGSSGGAAVAAAAGMGPLHIGTDLGGSIRSPASFCGVTGYKPTAGLFPLNSFLLPTMAPFESTGAIARSTEDLQLFLDGLLPNRESFDDGLPRLAETKTRIAFSPDLGIKGVEPEIAEVCARKITEFAGALQFDLDIVDLNFAHIVETWRGLLAYSIYTFFANLPSHSRALLNPKTLEFYAKGQNYSLNDLSEDLKRLFLFNREIDDIFGRFDFLITPAVEINAFSADLDSTPNGPCEEILKPFNLSQQPAASVCCGLLSSGMPQGVQIIGRRLADRSVLHLAGLVEEFIGTFSPPDFST